MVGNKAAAKTIANGAAKDGTKSKRVQVSGRQNLAMIRSGQDWSDTTPHKRKLYLETMHPVMVRGWTFSEIKEKRLDVLVVA